MLEFGDSQFVVLFIHATEQQEGVRFITGLKHEVTSDVDERVLLAECCAQRVLSETLIEHYSAFKYAVAVCCRLSGGRGRLRCGLVANDRAQLPRHAGQRIES